MVDWSSDSSRLPEELRIRNRLISSMNHDGATPSEFLDLLDKVTKDGLWQKMPDKQGKPFGTFIAFITAQRPDGLGLHDKADMEKHLALQHREERGDYFRQSTVDRLAEMRQRVREQMRDEVSEILPALHPGPGRGVTKTIRDTEGFTGGHADTADRVLARLKRDDPILAEDVIKGKVSPNAAARQKGWRAPRILVTTPERTAVQLKKHMSPEDITLLAAELLKGVECPHD